MTATEKPIPEQIVDVMQALSGHRNKFRAAHSKGIVCAGTFTAAPEARKISRAAHFVGQPVPVTIRFSNGSGDPFVQDGLPNARGIAVKFNLPAGRPTDLLAHNVEGFPVRTPEDLLAFLRCNLPDPATRKPDPNAVPRFLETHPETRAFIARLTQKPIPASYATAIYHAVHAFKFTAADGTTRIGRYRFRPEAGESYITPDDGAKRAPDFLAAELKARVARSPTAFNLELQLANSNDPTRDPTALWPADRPAAPLGRLEITAVSHTSDADERTLIFDPTNLTDGIDLTDDPLPAARSAAYSVSYERRTEPS